MNTPNINNQPIPGGRPGGTGDIGSRQKTERAQETDASEGTLRTVPETENPEQATARSVQDMFQKSSDRELANELTETAMKTEQPVREEAVSKARTRVQEGYYNSKEFMGNLATRLINTDRIT